MQTIEVIELSSRLKEVDILHYDVGSALVTDCKGIIYPCDFYALAVIQRSFSQVKAFCTLMETGSHPTAVAVLRMQLDNALRLWGVIHHEDPHDIARKVLRGEQLNKIGPVKDRMSDAWLCEQVSKERPVIETIYKASSSYIHFSGAHLENLMQHNYVVNEGTLNIGISNNDHYIPIEAKSRAYEHFDLVTRMTLDFVRDWSSLRQTAKPAFPE